MRGGGGEGERIAAPEPRAPSPQAHLDAGAAESFAACIRAGGVALFPADTVYGLACDPCNADALRRLYEIKGRPPAQPAAVMFFALAPALAALPELGPRTREALERLLPGPLTVLLPNPADRFALACRPAEALAAERPPADGDHPAGDHADVGRPSSAGDAALGLRVPSLAPSLVALARVEGPVLQSSANISGGPEARRLQDVALSIRAAVDIALDGGELPGVASTVLDLRSYESDGRWRVAREGPASAAALAAVLAD